MADNDAARMEDHFYAQSLLDPHCSFPDCPEAGDPQAHAHCSGGCGELVGRDSVGPCVNCLAIEANVPVRFVLRFDIAGTRFETQSVSESGPVDAALALERFAIVMGRAIAKAKEIALASVERPSRVEKVNRLLTLVSTKERRFFWSGGRVAQFHIGDDGRLRYADERGTAFLIHNVTIRREGFSHGGGLWRFVLSLRDFIERAEKIDYEFGEHWGYDSAPLNEIRAFALELGISEDSEGVPF